MREKTTRLSDYLDEHRYPGLFFRMPLIVRLVYCVNFILTLRNWHVKRELFKEEKKLRRGFMFLDAGCGMGEFALGTAKRFSDSKVYGVDFLESNSELAEHIAGSMRLNNARFERGDLTEMDERNKYDLVLCNSVLQFIEKDKKALRKIHDAMKVSGTLLLYVPVNYKRYFPWSSRLEDMYLSGHFYRYHDKFVMHRYGTAEVLDKVKNAGLKIKSCEYAYGVPGSVAFELYMMVLALIKRAPLAISIPAVIVYIFSLLPVQIVLMLVDFIFSGSRGNGILISAVKTR
jgi:ubiquinone/menaquinone biosynthesis C-methylase UbiE